MYDRASADRHPVGCPTPHDFRPATPSTRGALIWRFICIELQGLKGAVEGSIWKWRGLWHLWINKGLDVLKDEYKVTPVWWKEAKEMVQAEDGSWKLEPEVSKELRLQVILHWKERSRNYLSIS